jgi:hypothetical protein
VIVAVLALSGGAVTISAARQTVSSPSAVQKRNPPGPHDPITQPRQPHPPHDVPVAVHKGHEPPADLKPQPAPNTVGQKPPAGAPTPNVQATPKPTPGRPH